MSDILIKGMEMPTGCSALTLNVWSDGQVEIIDADGEWKTSKAVNVPEPHGRLGDLDRLERMFADIDNAPYSGFDGIEPFYSAEDAAQIIRLAPTVIQAEEG